MTIAVLSWKAHKTLVHTLESYEKFGLNKLHVEKIIFFQEIDDEDKKIAKHYGYQAYGAPINIGIAAGYKSLVELATSDLFLFLENDWELVEEPSYILYDAAERLRNNVIDIARLRSTSNPGEPLWSRQYMGQEMVFPEFLLDSAYWDSDPSKFSPIYKAEDWFVTTSSFATWTNNPTFFRTKWLKKEIVSRMGNTDIEVDIRPWWKEQKYNVAQHEIGLFTHSRLDR